MLPTSRHPFSDLERITRNSFQILIYHQSAINPADLLSASTSKTILYHQKTQLDAHICHQLQKISLQPGLVLFGVEIFGKKSKDWTTWSYVRKILGVDGLAWLSKKLSKLKIA